MKIFSSLKREELYRRKYSSEKEFKKGICDYMNYYNNERPHSHNRYKSPTVAEEAFMVESEMEMGKV